MSCATYALACFINDKLLASSQYESAIFALANSFLKSLKESIFNTRTVFTLLWSDPRVSITCLMGDQRYVEQSFSNDNTVDKIHFHHKQHYTVISTHCKN